MKNIKEHDFFLNKTHIAVKGINALTLPYIGNMCML